MGKKTKKKESCQMSCGDMGTCRVESLVGVDARGQMVLPKNIRKKAGIKAGDKLALVTWEKNNKVCCISLIKADGLETMVKDTLGPMMKGIM